MTRIDKIRRAKEWMMFVHPLCDVKPHLLSSRPSFLLYWSPPQKGQTDNRLCLCCSSPGWYVISASLNKKFSRPDVAREFRPFCLTLNPSSVSNTSMGEG